MSYGKSWEKHQIEMNEIWTNGNNSFVSVNDITKTFPDYMYSADMIYCDPPWSLQNVNMFNSKAGKGYVDTFIEFYKYIFIHIKNTSPKVCYLEIGNQNKNIFYNEMKKIFNVVQIWKIKYYNKYDCYLIRGSNDSLDFDYTNLDDTKTPLISIKNEKPNTVADFCTGRGLTGLACLNCGVPFVGTELNKRKLAVFIDKYNRSCNELFFKKYI